MKLKEEKILKIFLLFIILQPFFDILSFLSIRGIISVGISTIVKPLFVFIFGLYLLFTRNKNKRYWFIFISLFIIYMICHGVLFYDLLVDRNLLIHEMRFLVNIFYMSFLFIIGFTILKIYPDKERFLTYLKKTLLITFIIYFVFLLLAIITKTSGMTYEYADPNKLGYKGWNDSGQILGHAFSIVFPMLIYIVLSPKRKIINRIIIMLLFIIGVSLIGTKVPYFITLIVLVLYFIISIFIKLFNKKHQVNYFNIVFSLICIIGMLFSYKYTAVKHNTDINISNLGIEISTYDIKDESGYVDILTKEQLINKYPNRNINSYYKYQFYELKASKNLMELFKNKKIHPSNMRFKQIAYASKKYDVSSSEYKLFGLGFLNQPDTLALESDFFMALYSFGIFGFILFLLLPLIIFVRTTYFIIRNINKIDLETYMLYMGLGIFFSVSIYAGYTYIYTNFSIFLVIISIMLYSKIYVYKQNNINNNKITFLLLHLGYGGIESSTVNTCNSLCDKYEIELVCFYNLEKNQTNRLDERIKIRYILDMGPNKEELKYALKNKKIFKIFVEGIKALNILIKKRICIISEIRKNKSKYIISTRWEFSKLLSKYGNDYQKKIAIEHHYHNNNKKYIKVLSKKYYGIDILLALTKTLYNDYHVFLKKNKHTKIYLMPNMLDDIPNIKSDLKSHEFITMSRLDYGKRNDEIIRMFAQIKNKNWHLTVLGDGKEYDNLVRIVKELNLTDRVSLPGYIKKEDLPSYLLSSSVFLMASVTEGLPMVLLEAMSYGIPCIAFETASGVNDIIKNNKNGFVIKNRNQNEYVNKMELIIKDKKLLKSMSEEAIKTSKKFSKEEIVKIWYKILK